MSSPRKTTLDDIGPDGLKALFEKHQSIRRTAKALGVPYTTVQNAAKRWGISSPAGEMRLHIADHTGVTLRQASPRDASLVREAGFSPDEYEISSITVTEEDGDRGSSSKTRTSLKPRKPQLRLAGAGESIDPTPLRRNGKRQTIVVLSDHHAPLHDEELHRTSLDIIRQIKPDGVILLGDLMDFSAGISRHAPLANGFKHADPQECLDAAFEILRDIREALGKKGSIWLLEGNHDVRLQRKIASDLGSLENLRIAGTDTIAYGISHLLRFEELGVEMVLHKGLTYPQAFFEITPDGRESGGLVALHGTRARKGGGQSALATARERGHGVIMGHCHRLAVTSFNRWTTDGSQVRVQAIEAGAMARIDSTGLGYAPLESGGDQQAGFVVLNIYEDGTVWAEMVAWENEQAIFRGDVWSQKKAARKAA